ncbi:MAG: hypothetical protein CFE50_05920 [Pseudomonas sp. PGPPP4]|nr:MAG: hypothetical protein CFE50_05920 [Pseudomonas sp. PGPPP4]
MGGIGGLQSIWAQDASETKQLVSSAGSLWIKLGCGSVQVVLVIGFLLVDADFFSRYEEGGQGALATLVAHANEDAVL